MPFGSLGLGLGLGAHRKVDYGNMPATFSIAAGYANTGYKYINFSEPVTVTMTGGVTLSIDGTPYESGDTIPVASSYHLLTINNPGAEAGTITFGKRKQITFLDFYNPGSSVITGDITGMKLTYLRLRNLGSSVITGDITGMKLTYLGLNSLGSSVITGKITGMKLTALYLYGLGSSLTYGTNLLNIAIGDGVRLLGNTVFATAAEYARLIQDAANGTWSESYQFVIESGTSETDPGWENVKAYVAILRTKAAWTIIPAAWLTTGGGSWPTNWKEYEGE